ncbi:MAG: 1-acyl-sn-glycerol-3-phosphate acyltransferase [Chlamydiae bacterium]|nr:1-acyl-sn-glycerol-3-phosphate acyltransferase [Chlamydiota bacterium]
MPSELEKQFLKKLSSCFEKGLLSEKYYQIFLEFYDCYKKAVQKSNISDKVYVHNFSTLLELTLEQFKSPFVFESFHKKITEPFDYYSFGLHFITPLVDFSHSFLEGKENLTKIRSYLKNNENVILFANHQSEPDPHAISVLLQEEYADIAKDIIYVAGERVVTDPLAIPFSMGCNLLCIYSKKYIDKEPHLQHQKQLHNKRTMEVMSNLLSEGGKIIYVAPSGGRDRRNDEGTIELAPFDPQSIEMFHLMAKKAKRPTHFFTLALSTYDLLPPPEKTQIELGEKRIANKVGISCAFGHEVDMEHFEGSESTDKMQRRKNRADYIYNLVKKDYELLLKEKKS